MKKRMIFICICIGLMFSLCSCTLRDNKPSSKKELNSIKETYTKYLAEKYPDETFTVDVWQDYEKLTGGAGLPDYEGYVTRHVVTDSKGNRFKIVTKDINKYDDDYQEVLEGKVYYNEQGKHVYFDENGEVSFVSDY